MFNEEVHIELMSQSIVDKYVEIGNYTTTIPLSVDRDIATEAIEQIVKYIAEQVSKEWCAVNCYDFDRCDPYKVYRMGIITRDLGNGADRYAFSAEYSVDVREIVDALKKWDIIVDI